MTSSVGIAPYTGLVFAPKFSSSAITAPGMKTVTVTPQSDKATLNEKQNQAVAPHSGQTAASQLNNFERGVGSFAGVAMDFMGRLTSATVNNQSSAQRPANRLNAIA